MEPQITEISGYIVDRIPSDATRDEAKDAWRAALRHARNHGLIGKITDLLLAQAPHDPEIQRVCAELRATG